MFEQLHLFSTGSWLGVQSQQDPNDLVVIQQIVWEVKPKVIYDIGTNVGGSAIVFAHIMSTYAKPGEAIIVSVDPKHFSENWDVQAKTLCPKCEPVANNPLWGQYVQFVQATSTDKAGIDALEAAIAKYKGPVLVSVDGWHDYDEVISECRNLHKYVTNGSYMIVQDTKLDRLFNKPGPRAAARTFLTEDTASPGGPHFIVDRSREMLRYTQHSEGFLQRVKP
ncbi:hypothetical protein HXX76_009495 [Chlamydomonas incerta]|uniref:Rhamnosyl O-methyltransferase n=1 Tax=Chlamydomonas incerta TaxID=51695 RepID=A0A835T4L6_CHLIN|nr:hypothetical protein HXX76_009495 [Chlamydomonas incerta]|eukprot:KAG2431481.1 hypothetical protein HXX76_009495 [Chlamydomonas incerta]